MSKQTSGTTPKTLGFGQTSPAESPKALEALLPQMLKDLVFTLLGCLSNLASLKLFPALYQLYKQGKLPSNFAIYGVDRNPEMTSGSFRAWVRQDLLDKGEAESPGLEAFLDRIFYGGFDLQTGNYANLKSDISQLEQDQGISPDRTIVYFLAVWPVLFEPTIKGLGQAGLLADTSARIAVEKPFGNSLASAKALNSLLSNYCSEEQIFRMDHWLGKEAVQNLLAFRFANGIFEHLWNRQFIESIEITAAETVLVGARDFIGALIDMVLPSHLSQLVCLTMMEPPNSLNADDIRNEKVKLLRVLTADPKYAIRGVYDTYSGGPETYIALKLSVNNYRWAGVPVYVRTGKGLKRKISRIVVNFKRIPSSLFPTAQPNCLVLELQPNEGVSLSYQVKIPGENTVREQSLDFSYRSFKEPIPEAYERLIADIIAGDRTLFTRGDEAEAQWAVVMPILTHWQSIVTNNGNLSESDIVHQYPLGSDGLAAAETILENGHQWRSI